MRAYSFFLFHRGKGENSVGKVEGAFPINRGEPNWFHRDFGVIPATDNRLNNLFLIGSQFLLDAEYSGLDRTQRQALAAGNLVVVIALKIKFEQGAAIGRQEAHDALYIGSGKGTLGIDFAESFVLGNLTVDREGLLAGSTAMAVHKKVEHDGAQPVLDISGLPVHLFTHQSFQRCFLQQVFGIVVIASETPGKAQKSTL